MNDQELSQLELFSQSGEHSKPRVGIGSHFLRRIWAYEKAILMTMGFVVTAAVAFSLGIERGKNLASRIQPAIRADRSRYIPVQAQEQPLAERKPATVSPRKDKDIVNPQNYTIQLASYKSRASAQKEAQELKKRGLQALIVSKGKYAVLCVGSFTDKENAKALQSDLEKQYHGCFIRRI
jgi:septal ring-binding cell division protein DamX